MWRPLFTSCFLLVAALAPFRVHAEVMEFRLEPAGTVEVQSFGRAVAVDGNLLAVAARVAVAPGGSYEGGVLVYARDHESGDWMEEAIFTSDDVEPDEKFGAHVAVSGNTVAVSAPEARVGDERRAGMVWLFRRDADGKWLQSAKITDSTPEENEFFGIGLTVQGNVLAVGEISREEAERGSVTIFERSGPEEDDWARAALIEDPGIFPINDFGKALALDGDSLLVGAPLADFNCESLGMFSCQNVNFGAAFLYRKGFESAGAWGLAATLTDDRPLPRSAFGSSVALEGGRAVIGAPGRAGDHGNKDAGAVFVFERDAGGGWTQTGKLGSPQETAGLRFGATVALAGDRFWVGVPAAARDQKWVTGATYAYELREKEWRLAGEMFPPEGFDNERFGERLSLGEGLIFIAAPGYKSDSGAVYAFSAAGDGTRRPTFPSNGELVDDVVIVHESGVMIGATLGTREEAVPVWVVELEPPSDFPSPDFDPIGPTVRVGAPASRLPPEGSRYGLAIPVPEGADPARLTAFIRVSAADVYAQGPVDGEIWMPMPGVYNEDSGTYTVPMTMLSARGVTVTLAAPTSAAAGAEDPEMPPDSSAEDVFFRPSCAVSAAYRHECRERDEYLVEQHLDEAWAEYQGKGFERPYIASHIFDLHEEKFRIWAPPTSQGEFFYGVFLNARGDWFCSQTGNRSVAMPGMINFCFDYPLKTVSAAGDQLERLDTYILRAIRHELFHAIQFRYGIGGDDWVMEGQATLASQAPELKRNDTVVYMDVRDSLIAPRAGWGDLSPYKTQDFWKYLALRREPRLGYEYVKDIMAVGNTTAAVSEAIGSLIPGGTLGKIYWEFVKNQAMEKTVPLEAEFAERPCREEKETVRSVAGFTYTGEGVIEESRLLGPMSAELIKIGFWDYPQSREFIEDLHVEVEGPRSIQYKIYYQRTETVEEGFAPARKISDFQSECSSSGENEGRVFDRMELSDAEVNNIVWVLVANSGYREDGNVSDGGVRYTLRVYHGEGMATDR